MGTNQKPDIPHCWSTDPYLGNPGIKSVFLRECFEALNWYFHLNGSEQMPGRDGPVYDPLKNLVAD